MNFYYEETLNLLPEQKEALNVNMDERYLLDVLP